MKAATFHIAMRFQSSEITLLPSSNLFTLMAQRFSFFGLLALMLATTSPAALHAQDLQVHHDNGLLSVTANNVSAARLAEALSNKLPFNVVITGDMATLVNVDIVEEPLDKALMKLSPNNLLVRVGKALDSEIVELVLMMGEGSQGGSSSAGSVQSIRREETEQETIPAVKIPDSVQITSGLSATDPDRSTKLSDAAALASDLGMPAPKKPRNYMSKLPLDSAKGSPAETGE